MYELEEWDDLTIKFVSLYLKFKQSLTQFQHLINVSVKKTKTGEVFLNALKKANEVYQNLFKILEEYFSLIDPKFKSKSFNEKFEIIRDEFLGYRIFDDFLKVREAIKYVNDNKFQIINEFKRNVGIKYDDSEITVLDLREMEKRLLEFLDIVEKLVNEVKNKKFERSYKI